MFIHIFVCVLLSYQPRQGIAIDFIVNESEKETKQLFSNNPKRSHVEFIGIVLKYKKEMNGKEWGRGGAMDEQQKQTRKSKFQNTKLWDWVVDNKFIAFLLVLLLILLNTLLLIEMKELFRPIVLTLQIIGPPIVFAGIFYYLIKPLIGWLERKGMGKNHAVLLVLFLLLLLIIWGIAIVLPIIRDQLISFWNEWPEYWRNFTVQLDDFLNTQAFSDLMTQMNETDIVALLTEQWTNIVDATVGGIGSIIGVVAQFFITIFTFPILLYYLLKEGEKLPDYVFQFIPINIRGKARQVFSEMNEQLSSYIRGQMLVALSVGIMFWIGFSIVGLDYAVTLGFLAGVLNLVPYLGSILATIPALVIAIVDSPFMLLKVLLVFAVEQIIEGRIVSPQILGTNLKIHPVTILFILLVAGRLFGVAGLILGVPGYAVLKIIASHLFLWYKERSGLYREEDRDPEPSEALVDTEE